MTSDKILVTYNLVISTQGTLVREHVSTPGLLARKTRNLTDSQLLNIEHFLENCRNQSSAVWYVKNGKKLEFSKCAFTIGYLK